MFDHEELRGASQLPVIAHSRLYFLSLNFVSQTKAPHLYLVYPGSIFPLHSVLHADRGALPYQQLVTRHPPTQRSIESVLEKAGHSPTDGSGQPFRQSSLRTSLISAARLMADFLIGDGINARPRQQCRERAPGPPEWQRSLQKQYRPS